MPFTPLPERELNLLSEDALVAYGRAARAAGDDAAARTALAMLVWGLQGIIERRVKLRVPPEVAEEVAHDALVRALGAAFDGSSVGELRSWLNTILDRTCVDFFRRRGRRPSEDPLPGSGDDADDGPHRPEPSLDGEAGAVEVGILVDTILDSYSDAHREVVALHVFDGLTAPEVCARIEDMSEDNVAKIASRFRARLRAELDAGPGGGR